MVLTRKNEEFIAYQTFSSLYLSSGSQFSGGSHHQMEGQGVLGQIDTWIQV